MYGPWRIPTPRHSTDVYVLSEYSSHNHCFCHHGSDPRRKFSADFLIKNLLSSGVCAAQMPNKIFRYVHTEFCFFPLLHSMAKIAQLQRFYQILRCLHIAMF